MGLFDVFDGVGVCNKTIKIWFVFFFEAGVFACLISAETAIMVRHVIGHYHKRQQIRYP